MISTPRTCKMLKSGFTLIELLVVISILSILTIITVSQFNTAKKKGRDVQRKGDLNSLSKALMMYNVDYGVFPRSDSVTPDPVDINELIEDGAEFEDQGYTYMAKVPRENYQGANIPNYCYVVSADGKKFGLFSKLENVEDPEYQKYSAGVAYSPIAPCNQDEYDYAVFSPNASYADFD